MCDLTDISRDVRISSRQVAELTGRRHDRVLRDIGNIINSLPDYETPNLGFHNSAYRVAGNRKSYPEYLLTSGSCAR